MVTSYFCSHLLIGMILAALPLCLLPFFSKKRVVSGYSVDHLVLSLPSGRIAWSNLGVVGMMAPCSDSAVAHRRVALKILVVLWALSLWFHLDGLQHVRPAAALACQSSGPLVSRACVPRGLDVEKFHTCAPKKLAPGEWKQRLAEAIEKKAYPTRRNPRRVPDKHGRWRCNKCGQMLPEDAFTLVKSGGRQIPLIYCKRCMNRYQSQQRRLLRGNLQVILDTAKKRAKQKLKCTLTWDDLYQMVRRQHGRCAYSGVSMETCTPNSHWRMSLERRDNSKGYSKENCVFVAAEFNTGDCSRHRGVRKETVKGTAQWSHQKVQAVFDLRQQDVDLEVLRKDIKTARHRPQLSTRRAKCPAVEPTAPHQDYVYCRACAEFLDPHNFTPSALVCGGECKACKREYDRAFSSTLRGHVRNCLKNARYRARKRGQPFSLDLHQVLHMLEQQGGCCYYSGVPLEYKRPHSDWRMSLERLDNSPGYTAENCVLIAIEFNTADHSRNSAVTKVFGTAQWSREKVEHIWGKTGWAKNPIPI